MIHILFMILKALGILLLVLLFLVLLIVCTVLFLPFCYRAQVLKEEERFACVKASGRVSWLFGGTEAGGADSAFRGITGNMETAAEKDPPGRSVRVPDGGK